MAKLKYGSLRKRLALILIPVFVFLLLFGGVAQYLLTVRPMQEEFDRSLIDSALALADHIDLNDQGEIIFSLSQEAETLLKADNLDHIWYAAFDDDLHPFAGTRGLSWPKAKIQRGQAYLYDAEFANEKVRAVAMKVACGPADCGVVLAQTTHKRARIVRSLWLTALLPMFLLGLGAVALLWFGIGKGLLPLVTLSREIGRRSPRELSQLNPESTPTEVLPLVQAVNELMAQLDASATAQQRFLATAAHQLRTPLAGLQSQIELALLEAPDEACRRSLSEIHASAMRAARLAVQLLSLARAEPGASKTNVFVSCDLANLASELADEWVPRALARQIDLGFELASAPVRGDPLLLRELMANLLHNAIEYTPAGGHVTVRSGQDDAHAYFWVEDDGPGIPAEMREKVLERFVRLPGSAGAGSGLGLAIVKEIADAHHAVLSLEGCLGGHGLLVKLCFPKRR